MGDDFTKLEQDAWGGLLGIHGRMSRAIDVDLQTTSGITHVEFEVLLRLSWVDSHSLRIQELAARSVLTSSGMSRAVERLERKGLVTRETAPEDRRGAYAVLTQSGAEHLQGTLQAHVAFVRKHFLGAFSMSELGQMAAFWRKAETLSPDSK